MQYSLSFFKGLGWNGGLKVLTKILTAVKLAILARLLSPNDFGLFSIVLVSISLVEVFSESGINTILVQASEKIDHYLDTAWVFSIARGCVIAGITITLAFLATEFFKASQLLPLMLLASFVPLIRGFINPAIIHFYKELEFKRDTIYRFSLFLSEFFTAIILAFIFHNTFSLVLALVISAVVDVWISFAFVKSRPKFKYQPKVLKEIFLHSKWLNQIAVLDYLNKNLDDLIIGKFLGVSQLGYYKNAYGLSQSATADFGQSVIHASFPVYTKFKTDVTRLRRAYLKVVLLFAVALIFPTALLLFIPELITTIILGPTWKAAAVLLPFLGVSGYIQGIYNVNSTLLTVRRKYSFLLIQMGVTFVTMIISLVIFLPQFGLIGSGVSILLSRLAALPLFIFFTYQTLRPFQVQTPK